MKNRWFEQEQPSVENIREELSIQDITLRQDIVKNSSRNTQQAKFAERESQHMADVVTPFQEKQNSTNYVFGNNGQFDTFWARNTPSSSSQKKGEVKINSLVYHQREGREPSCFFSKKKKLNVSLSLKGKTPKSKDKVIELGGKAKLKREMFGEYKENCQQGKSFSTQMEQKINELKPQGSLVKIQQPDFHSRHPLRQEGRFNGYCLSGIIIRKALQTKN